MSNDTAQAPDDLKGKDRHQVRLTHHGFQLYDTERELLSLSIWHSRPRAFQAAADLNEYGEIKPANKASRTLTKGRGQ